MYPKQRVVQKITEAARQGVLPWEQSFFLIKNMEESPRPERGFDAGMTFLEKPKRERPDRNTGNQVTKHRAQPATFGKRNNEHCRR